MMNLSKEDMVKFKTEVIDVLESKAAWTNLQAHWKIIIGEMIFRDFLRSTGRVISNNKPKDL
jgi:hypothetical protein